MPRLIVQEVCPFTRVFRDDGAKLREAIVANWSEVDPVEVDFDHEMIASTSFLDEGIAQLFLMFEPEVIRQQLRLVNLDEGDRRELNTLVALRRSQRDAA